MAIRVSIYRAVLHCDRAAVYRCCSRDGSSTWIGAKIRSITAIYGDRYAAVRREVLRKIDVLDQYRISSLRGIVGILEVLIA